MNARLIAGAIVAALGVAMVALGLYGHDTQAVFVGSNVAIGDVAFLIGWHLPSPNASSLRK